MINCGGQFQERNGVLICSYDGSITVAHAIKLMRQPGTYFSGSDWKYGWPHKFYFEPVNLNADKTYYVSSANFIRNADGSYGDVDGTHEDDFWTCRAHGPEFQTGSDHPLPQERRTCVCPRDKMTGYWSHAGRGRYERLYFKFYNIHLLDASDEELKEFSSLSERVFGIKFERDEKGIKYSAPPTRSFYGYQRDGEIDQAGEPVHTL